MFLGQFDHNIDEKGRLTIPAKFRGELAAGLVVTKAIDACLWLYPLGRWAELAAKIDAQPLTDPSAREFRRQVYAGASDAVPDRQGRVILPPGLREYANINNQAVIIGLHDHCEIWNPDRWRERQQRSDDDPEGRAAMFENLGI